MVAPLLFIGSGISIALADTLRDRTWKLDWRSLLNDAAAELLGESLASSESQDAADELVRKAGPLPVQTALQRLIEHHENDLLARATSELSGMPGLLLAIRATGIFTTNWDTLLDRLMPGYDSLDWPADKQAVVQHIRTEMRFICHLHGSVRAGHLAVTTEDIEAAASTFVGSPDLSTILATRPIAVIGYSLRDAPILERMRVAVEIGGAAGCTVFMNASSAADFRSSAKTRELAKRVRIETYPDHSALFGRVAGLVEQQDPGLSLISFSSIRGKGDLDLILGRIPYRYGYSSEIRRAAIRHRDPPELLRWASELLIDVIGDDTAIGQAGVLATLLSVLPDRWSPQSNVARELTKRSLSILDGDLRRVGIVEPLVFALGATGHTGPYRKHLDRSLLDDRWSTADWARILDYYEHQHELIRAIDRHLSERGQRGLLKANDTGRAIRLLPMVPVVARSRVYDQALESILVLWRAGEIGLTRAALVKLADARRLS